MAVLLLSKWTGVLILKGIPEVMYLSFALYICMCVGEGGGGGRTGVGKFI